MNYEGQCMVCEAVFGADDPGDLALSAGVLCPECRKAGRMAVGVVHLRKVSRPAMVVAELEKLLELAKSGEVVSLTVLVQMTEGREEFRHTAEAQPPDPEGTLRALDAMRRSVVRGIEGG